MKMKKLLNDEILYLAFKQQKFKEINEYGVYCKLEGVQGYEDFNKNEILEKIIFFMTKLKSSLTPKDITFSDDASIFTYFNPYS